MHRPSLGLLISVLGASIASAQTVTAQLSDTVIAPKSRVGIGVNGGGGWYHLVSANLVDNPCFEGPADSAGLSQLGWPWAPTTASALTASVDTTAPASGKQSQKLVVTGAPVALRQGRVDLPQAPLVLKVTPSGSYVIKARFKSSMAGAHVRLGIMVGGWTPTYSPPIAVTTGWAEYSWTFVPTQTQALIGLAYELQDNATYWVDDFIAWNANDRDPDTGLSATFVNRLKELKPATLRLGGLGVNGIPLESYLFQPWTSAYGPPPLSPDFDLNTFLKLCKAVGADPFITVPPAFSDATHAALGDLTDDVVDNWFQDHGNLIDYLGGDASTTYGARREADGFPRWDTQFTSLYFETGNEIWGTPDGKWDMKVGASDSLLLQQQRLVRYNTKRMTEMKARPGWRANMRVGFGGRDPNIWIGSWAGSYNATVVPPLKDLTDFSTLGMYYGPETASTSDDALFGDLFARSLWFEGQTKALKASFFTAAGNKDVESTVYEGAAVWGPYSAHLDRTVYGKEVSLGAAVSLLDHFAAANRAGVTVNNLFHFTGNVWAVITASPESFRKPTFLATKLFTTELSGNLVTCTLTGAGTYVSGISGEPATPLVDCYAYKNGAEYRVLFINRSRTTAQSITLDKPLVMSSLLKLAGPDINANNETAETVQVAVQDLNSTPGQNFAFSLPPFSAFIAVGHENTGTAPDAPTPATLPDGVQDVPYGPVTMTATGTQPLQWSVDGGALPPGLRLNATSGVYDGTPRAAGEYDFTVVVTNPFGTASRAYHHTIQPPGSVVPESDGGVEDAGTGSGAPKDKVTAGCGGCTETGASFFVLSLCVLLASRRRTERHSSVLAND